MIKHLTIKNFRSLVDVQMDLGKINVFYGKTGSGKSSIFYPLLSIKNFYFNPNQNIDGLFNYKYISLGGFAEVLSKSTNTQSIEINLEYNDSIVHSFCIKNNSIQNIIRFLEFQLNISSQFTLPYQGNQNFSTPFKSGVINFTGLTAGYTSNNSNPSDIETLKQIVTKINQINDKLKSIDIIPPKRGFYAPNYSLINLTTPFLIEDTELASFIANNADLQDVISEDLNGIAQRNFRVHNPIGSALFQLRIMDKKNKIPTNIINEGFGINQLVYMLAKLRRSDVKVVMLEEPEIHLHPELIRNFVKVLIEIVNKEDKQLFITTHSETFVLALLEAIKKKEMEYNQVKCFLAKKVNGKSIFEEQKVNEKGQIEGGLKNFVENEIEILKSFFE